MNAYLEEELCRPHICHTES